MQQAESLESTLLREAGFRHSFFTRRGGVSSGPYASLNFSVTVGDDEHNVRANLGRAAEALGVGPASVYYLSQVHGREVHVLEAGDSPELIVAQRADALVSRTPGVACGVRTADCVPILIGDRVSGGVAAIHAGWRGTVAGVVAATVGALSKLSGGRAELVAAIGPHISVAAFEVGEDVAAELDRAAPGSEVVEREPGRKPRVNLRRALRAQLRRQGLSDAAIDDVGGCTVGEPELYFSYRRDGPRSGRHLSAIVPHG